jgi:hypothetical protein
MMKNIVTFFNCAQKAVETGGEDKKVTWSSIKAQMNDLIYKITCMKFQVILFGDKPDVVKDPATGEDKVVAHMKAVNDEIVQAFRNLDS